MFGMCRICGSDKIKFIFLRRFYNISDEFINEYPVCICKDCGFCFAANIKGQEFLDNYYENYSKYTGNINYSFDTVKSRGKVIDITQKYLKNLNAKIIDIGCGDGNLLSALQKAGYKNLVGADPSAECVERIKSIENVKAVQSTIDNFFCEDTADAVFLMSVLEHVFSLHDTMKKVYSFLDDNSYLFVEVPDIRDFIQKDMVPFQEFSTEHINFFSEKTLAFLAARNGFCHIESVSHVPGGIFCVFKKERDIESEEKLLEYIDESKGLETAIVRRLNPYAGIDVIVWGVGTFCRYLLAEGIIQKCSVVAFVDTNRQYRESPIRIGDREIPVVSPDELKSTALPIIITSKQYQDEIVDIIRNKLSLTCEIVTLFD